MARLAGISLILMALLAGAGYGYGFRNIYVAGDALATLQHLESAPDCLVLIISSFLLILVLDLIVAGALFLVFRSAGRFWAWCSAGLRLLYAAILAVAIGYLCRIPQFSDQRDGVAVLHCLDSFLDTWSWGLVVFGAHLCALGILLRCSSFVPRILSVLAVVAGLCYMLTNLADRLLPGYEAYRDQADNILALPMALGELVLAIWLIRADVRPEQRLKQ